MSNETEWIMSNETDLLYATEFAKRNLQECACEILEWQDTAVLCDGKIRQLAKLCHWAGDSALRIAQSLVERAAIESIARHNNHESS